MISGGERGRQAGSGDLRGLAGTQTCLPPSRAAPGKPGPPVLDPPRPRSAAGGRLCRSAFGWWCPHGASQSPKIPAVPSKAVLARARSFNPQPGEQESRVPADRATPKTEPWLEPKSKGKAGRCLGGRGPPSASSTRRPPSPWQGAADNCTNKIDFNPHIPIPLIGRPSRRQLPGLEQLQSAVCDREGWQMQPLIPQEWGRNGSSLGERRAASWKLAGWDAAGSRQEKRSRAELQHHCLGSPVGAGGTHCLLFFPRTLPCWVGTRLLPAPGGAPRADGACCGHSSAAQPDSMPGWRFPFQETEKPCWGQ